MIRSIKTTLTCLFQNYLGIKVTLAMLLLSQMSYSQNVGVGTPNPLRKFSVTGSIMVDQNSNNMGTLDSAALVFGNSGNSGITSRKASGDINNLMFWTSGVPYMNLSPTGNLGVGGNYGAQYRLWVRGGNTRLDDDLYMGGELTAIGNTAIGGSIDPLFRLRVYNGNTRFGGDMHATGNVAFGGEVDNEYRLRVIGGNSRFGGDMHATGNVGVGGLPDNNFKLKVYNGSTYLDGHMQVTGHTTMASIGATGNISTGATVIAHNVNVTNSLTIDGKGSVRSNGPSALRIGFDMKTVNVLIGANSGVSVTADITDFTGDNDDVRVFVSQISLGGGNTMLLDRLTMNITNVNAANDNCLIRLANQGNVAATLVATIYLTTIAKN